MPVTINGTTGVIGPDGSAGTPAYQGSDANTGMFFPAADTIAFAEGGTEVARFDSSGNLGIGTSSPVSRLNVSITDGGSVTISNTNDTHTGALNFGDTSSNTSGRISYDHSSNALRFDSNGAERARFDSSGNFLVGKTVADDSTTGFAYRSSGYISAARNGGAPCFFNRTGTDGAVVEIGNDGSTVGTISVSGSSTAYNTSSDYRLKEDIQPMSGALAKIAALKPVTYKWKVDGSDGEGFIAHELQAVVPACVTGAKDAVDADGKPVYQGIDTSFLVATLTAAIQEQQALITSLTARIAALEGAAQ